MNADQKLIRVAMVLNTDGLEYDDRIRKEILTIQSNCPYISFKIFAIVPDNRAEEGITDYGVPYQLISLKTRTKYPSGKKKVFKAYEFYRVAKRVVKDYDVVWCADCHTFFLPLLLSRKKIVWDLHELPTPFMGHPLKRTLFQYMEKRCDLFYHANRERIDYLISQEVIRQTGKHFAIRNFPESPKELQKGELIRDKFKIFDDFETWVGDTLCVYLQGIYEDDRRSYQSMAAVMEIDNLKAVVVGRPDQEALSRIRQKYGMDEVNRKLFLTGMIPQKYTTLFVNRCVCSLVFYSINQPNNKYCEPNRLFQTVLSGLPVVVGCNPPMKKFVENIGAGIVLKSDGSDLSEVRTALSLILQDYELYKQNIISNKSKMYWESQEDLIVNTFLKYIVNQ